MANNNVSLKIRNEIIIDLEQQQIFIIDDNTLRFLNGIEIKLTDSQIELMNNQYGNNYM